MNRPEETSEAEIIDLTLTAASLDDLRRRAAEGDQQALAEIARRQAGEIAEEAKAA